MSRNAPKTSSLTGNLPGGSFSGEAPTGNLPGGSFPLGFEPIIGNGDFDDPDDGPRVDPSILNYDFIRDILRGPALNVSRSSAAYIDDSAGNWTLVPANTLRRSDKGVLIEGAATNSIRNNSMQGAVVGSPGTLPTNWAIANNVGLSYAIVGLGTERGIDYVDIRFSGTASGAGVIGPGFDSSTAAAAANGQLWTLSMYLKLVGGTLTNVSAINLGLDENTSGGAFVRQDTGLIANPDTSALSSQRRSMSVTLSGGGTVGGVSPWLRVSITGAGAVDFTLRIGWPQLEQWSTSVTTTGGASSPIRTTGSAATRAADVVTGTLASAIASGTFAGVVNPVIDTSNQTVAQIGVTTDRFVLRRSTASLAAVEVVGNAGVGTATSAVGFTAGARHGFAGAFAPNDTAVSINGTVPGTASPTSVLGAQSALTIGSGVQFFNGYIERLALYPSRLSNAQLQTLSTLATWGG